MPSRPQNSLVVPVFRNEANIPGLLTRCAELSRALDGDLEVVFVVDASPDRSWELLHEGLQEADYSVQLVALSRNFGSFAAIRQGMECAGGNAIAVMAADLQEPADLILEFFSTLATGDYDIVLGSRGERKDPALSSLLSRTFWAIYRRLVMPEIPPGGVDVFGCNRRFADELLKLEETNNFLVGQLMWLGFRRRTIRYDRQERTHGRSAWTLVKKFRYLVDSVYAFTSLPITALLLMGVVGLGAAAALAIAVIIAKITGGVAVPGYAATVITILFFSGINLVGLGIIGLYVWKAYVNTMQRPQSIIMRHEKLGKRGDE